MDSGMIMGFIFIFLIFFAPPLAIALIDLVMKSIFDVVDEILEIRTKKQLAKRPLEARLQPIQNSKGLLWDPLEDKLYKDVNGMLVVQKTYSLKEMLGK